MQRQPKQRRERGGGDDEAHQRGPGRAQDQPAALARDRQVERALEHDQDQAERAQHRDDRVDPPQMQAGGIERLAQRDAGADRQHDGGQAEAATEDVEQVGEQQQRRRGEDRGVGHGPRTVDGNFRFDDTGGVGGGTGDTATTAPAAAIHPGMTGSETTRTIRDLRWPGVLTWIKPGRDGMRQCESPAFQDLRDDLFAFDRQCAT